MNSCKQRKKRNFVTRGYSHIFGLCCVGRVGEREERERKRERERESSNNFWSHL